MPADTILVVDDDLQLLMLAARMLKVEGYVVHTAPSTEEALDVAAGLEPISLLFTDVVLPGRSGLELAVELRETRPELPVLVTTGEWHGNVRTAIDRSGFHLLCKPYDFDEIHAAVRRAMTTPDPGPVLTA